MFFRFVLGLFEPVKTNSTSSTVRSLEAKSCIVTSTHRCSVPVCRPIETSRSRSVFANLAWGALRGVRSMFAIVLFRDSGLSED
jgi:hypothetical protein